MSLALIVLALGAVILVAALLLGSRSAWERFPRWAWLTLMAIAALIVAALLVSVIVTSA